MRRNMFGEARPANGAEIWEAIEEAIGGKDGEIELYAVVEYADDDGDFTGWNAEVRNDNGDEIFTTLGYAEDRQKLLTDLQSAGITEIEIIE